MEYGATPNRAAFLVSGRHAERYLHARLTCDIRGLVPGAMTTGGALSPQGRTLAFGAFYRLDAERFLFVSDGGEPEAIAKAILQFKVADQVTMERVLGAGSWWHVLDVSAVPPLPGLFDNVREPVLFARNRCGVRGADLFIPAGGADAGLSKFGTLLAPPEFEARRLRAAKLEFPVELGTEIPFPADLCPDSVSFTKGCYAGQEVIAKIDAFGKPPRTIAWFEGPSGTAAVARDLQLKTADGPLGKVLASGSDSIGLICSALVRTDELEALGLETSVTVDGIPLKRTAVPVVNDPR